MVAWVGPYCTRTVGCRVLTVLNIYVWKQYGNRTPEKKKGGSGRGWPGLLPKMVRSPFQIGRKLPNRGGAPLPNRASLSKSGRGPPPWRCRRPCAASCWRRRTPRWARSSCAWRRSRSPSPSPASSSSKSAPRPSTRPTTGCAARGRGGGRAGMSAAGACAGLAQVETGAVSDSDRQ